MLLEPLRRKRDELAEQILAKNPDHSEWVERVIQRPYDKGLLKARYSQLRWDLVEASIEVAKAEREEFQLMKRTK